MKIDISIGELFDKVSILRIKSEQIQDKNQLAEVNKELLILEGFIESFADSEDHINKLLVVNRSLWLIEDKIREKERTQDFGAEFVELARSVYKTNDRRFAIKNEINLKFNSSIKEQKQYNEY